MTGGKFLRTLLLFGVTLWALNPVAFAQNEANPFELNHRLPKDRSPENAEEASSNPFDIEAKKTEENSIPAEPKQEQDSASENPFDVKRVKPKANTEKSKPTVSPSVVPSSKKKIQKPADTRSGFLFWSLLAMMILLALFVTLYRSLIGKIYRAFTNENILKLLQREQAGFISLSYLFLYLLFFISGGVFIFQVAYHYELISFDFNNLAYCIIGLCGFFMLKHMILKILEFIFPIKKEVKLYNFTILIFSIILGILLVPSNIFIAFVQDSYTYIGLTFGFLTVIAIYLFRYLRGIFIASKFLAFHKFHFFMYICAVEIAPLIILAKLIMKGAIIH